MAGSYLYAQQARDLSESNSMAVQTIREDLAFCETLEKDAKALRKAGKYQQARDLEREAREYRKELRKELASVSASVVDSLESVARILKDVNR